jgi:poly-gamma-glutamate synthesis protein (capsule biosynthesis protein)
MTALLAAPARPFSSEILPVSSEIRARIEGVSWKPEHPQCPPLDALAYLRLDHVTFDGGTARGELLVAAAIARRTVELFRRLYALGFPIRQMRLVDDFGADDDASMTADNTSAFNFRTIAGTDLLSQHALGLAIDIDPVENPWRRPDKILPAAGISYADRSEIRPGMIVRPGPVVAIFDELGWEWGGDWLHAFDDHHVVWSRPHASR